MATTKMVMDAQHCAKLKQIMYVREEVFSFLLFAGLYVMQNPMMMGHLHVKITMYRLEMDATTAK